MSALVLALLILLATPALAGDRPAWQRHGCRDTRALVIAERCTSIEWDAKGCHVARAVCPDPYAGVSVATDDVPHAVQVDHRIPWHWLSQQTAGWPESRIAELYNDHGNLVPVRSRTNARKSDLMPSEWCPANAATLPAQSGAIRATAAKWGLHLPAADVAALRLWDRGECSPGAKVVP